MNSLESIVLLRISRFFTGIFAVFMGFLAVFLDMLGFNLGWVYMSMGVLIGSAVGPAALTICYEKANGIAVGAGAVGGLVLGMLGWCIKAQVDSGEVTYESLGSDWPWVVGNLCAIFGGLLISFFGSLAFPDNEFKWEMLNDRIPLVDDVEPPRNQRSETPEKMLQWLYIAVGASLLLTFIMIVVWPLPMHWFTGVLGDVGFTIWVTLEILWVLVGGVLITFLPLYETVVDLQASTQERLERELAAQEAEEEAKNNFSTKKKTSSGTVALENLRMSSQALQAKLESDKTNTDNTDKHRFGLRKPGGAAAPPEPKAAATMKPGKAMV
jgi:uncharacterized integral membrane protein